MEKAAPRPVFGARAQSFFHRVPMNVVQFLYELRMIPNVEIVVALLPEMIGVADQTPCHSLLQRLQGVRQSGWPIQARCWLEWVSSLRLAEEKVDVLRHHNIS